MSRFYVYRVVMDRNMDLILFLLLRIIIIILRVVAVGCLTLIIIICGSLGYRLPSIMCVVMFIVCV